MLAKLLYFQEESGKAQLCCQRNRITFFAGDVLISWMYHVGASTCVYHLELRTLYENIGNSCFLPHHYAGVAMKAGAYTYRCSVPH